LAGVRLDPEAEITLYRVAHEALTDVRKHAGQTAGCSSRGRCYAAASRLGRGDRRDARRGMRRARACSASRIAVSWSLPNPKKAVVKART
jgi:hypothetical protein